MSFTIRTCLIFLPFLFSSFAMAEEPLMLQLPSSGPQPSSFSFTSSSDSSGLKLRKESPLSVLPQSGPSLGFQVPFEKIGNDNFPGLDLTLTPAGSKFGLNLRRQNGIGLSYWDIGSSDHEGFFNTARTAGADYQSYETNYQCVADSEGEIFSVANDLNWNNCFDKRISESVSPGLPSKEYLKKDQEVCECLKNSKFEAVADRMKRNYVVKRTDTIPLAEHDAILNGLAFQAFVVNQSEATSKDKTNLLGKIVGYAHSLYFDQSSKFKFLPQKKLFKDEGPYPANVCITPIEFFLVSQRPGKSLVSELQQGVSEKDWDYKALQAEYMAIMKEPVEGRRGKEARIKLLKDKLKFLTKNPVIKYVLGSSAGGKHKSDMVSALKLLADTKCQIISSECSKNFNKSLSEIMQRPKVRTLVRSEAIADHKERSQRKQGGQVLSERRRDLSQKSIISEFMKAYKLGHPDKCKTDPANGVECLEIFSGYCHTLDKYEGEISGLGQEPVPVELQNDLEEDLEDAFNPDPEKNEDYKRYVKSQCETPRFSSWGSSKSSNFENFVKTYCSSGSGKAGCPLVDGKIKSAADLQELRSAWTKEFSRRSQFFDNKTALDQNVDSLSDGSFKAPQMAKADVDQMSNGPSIFNYSANESDLDSSFSEVVSRSVAPLRSSDFEKLNDSDFVSDAAVPGDAGASEVERSQTFEGFQSQGGFSSLAQGSQIPDQQKIEDMPQAAREDLLHDWQKEYDDWKKSRGDAPLTPQELAKDSAMKEEIQTLKKLLSQQQELNQQQYRMLNEAIVARSKPLAAPNDNESDNPVSKRSAQDSQFARAASNLSEDTQRAFRAPSSIDQKSTVGAQNGASASVRASTSSRNAFSRSSGDPSDSVSREEAKLVNLRRFSDGSILIEDRGVGASGANAISVAVSDEQYRQLQANPTGLSLRQLESAIPQDQIAKLERNGEITLLLRNGTNPPFEVKVEKKNNRLVYSLKDKNGKEQAPIRRVFTRQALEQELKAQR